MIVNKTLIIQYAVSIVNFEDVDTPTVYWGSLGLNLRILDLHCLYVSDIGSRIFLSDNVFVKVTDVQFTGKCSGEANKLLLNFTLLSHIDITKPKGKSGAAYVINIHLLFMAGLSSCFFFGNQAFHFTKNWSPSKLSGHLGQPDDC